MIQLMHGNCLELMKSIPEESIDAIITDPPYGTTACKWDSVIPFDLMWEQLNRIIKPNGAIVLFGSEPFSSLLRMSNIENYKYDWHWNKSSTSGFVNAKLKPMNTMENIIIFSNGKTSNGNKNNMPYNPQDLIVYNKITKNGASKKENSTFREGNKSKDGYIQQFTNYPRNYLSYKYVNKSVHPTQKPIALMEYLIKTYTNEGETVLDFTMGSGTTGVAAKNLNRNFIGIEMDDNYFNIAQNRINQ